MLRDIQSRSETWKTTICQLPNPYVLSNISQQFLLLKMMNISLLLHINEFHLFLWKVLQFTISLYFSTLICLEASQQSSKYIRSLTLSLASAVQCPQFVCFSDLRVPSFSRILEGQPWGNSASRRRAREAALRANCALHPLSCSFYPLFALSLQKKDT